MTTSELSQLIYSQFGTVTRARNCFLYTKKGVRLTDMFQENGRAILGWQGDSAFTHLKNVLNRSQTGSFITEDKERINKAVSSLLNSDRKVFYFSDKNSALKAGITISPEGTSFYRPWTVDQIDWSKINCAIITPPFPWTDTIYLLAVKTEISESIPDFDKMVIGKVKFPFAIEAGITRGIYNLIEALPLRQEKDFFIYDSVLTKYWTRKGPYLFPKIPEEKYNAFVKHCIEQNIVINPNYNSPSIIPFGADKGVFTKLKNNPFEF